MSLETRARANEPSVVDGARFSPNLLNTQEMSGLVSESETPFEPGRPDSHRAPGQSLQNLKHEFQAGYPSSTGAQKRGRGPRVIGTIGVPDVKLDCDKKFNRKEDLRQVLGGRFACNDPAVRERHRKNISVAMKKWSELPDVKQKMARYWKFRKLMTLFAKQLRDACVLRPERKKWEADRFKERYQTDLEFRASILARLRKGCLTSGKLGGYSKVDKAKHAASMQVALKRNISRPEKFIEACLKASGHSFTAQAQLPGLFETFGKTCIWDFVVPDKKLAVEVDGERWHNREKDAARDQMATQLGWRVVRIPVKKVLVKSPAYKRWLKTYRWPTETAA